MHTLATHSDDELVALVRLGDADAFAEIARRHRPMMVAQARPLLAGTAFDAEDAAQDALIRAQRALPATEGPLVLRAWLTVVVRNRALDLRRRRDAFTDELPPTLVADHDVAETAALRDHLRTTVRALRALPDRQRTALVGHVLEGVPHRELAHRLDTTVPPSRGSSRAPAPDSRRRHDPHEGSGLRR